MRRSLMNSCVTSALSDVIPTVLKFTSQQYPRELSESHQYLLDQLSLMLSLNQPLPSVFWALSVPLSTQGW